MTKKKTIEEVRVAFSQRGFTLVSEKYNGAHSILDYRCSNGHQAKIRFDDLQSGHGCAECAGLKKKTLEEVRAAFNQRGFTLLSNEYKNSKSLLNYICDQCHNATIRFDDLRSGHGCSSCANHGFDPSKNAILYYLRFQFEGNFYYKIGITNNTIASRFQSEKIPCIVIKETGFPLGKDAYTQEQDILKKFSSSRYKGKPFLRAGNTELFSRDVLQLDYEPFQNFAA